MGRKAIWIPFSLQSSTLMCVVRPSTIKRTGRFRYNTSNKVFSDPSIKYLCYHPTTITLSQVRTSYSTFQRITIESFSRIHMHRGDYTTCCICCNQCGNLRFGIRGDRIHMFLVPHSNHFGCFWAERESILVGIPYSLWFILQAMFSYVKSP